MDKILSILDKIRSQYIQINLDKFVRIKNLLGLIWEQFQLNSNINSTIHGDYEEQITLLLDFFDPKKNPNTRIKVIEQLPSKARILEENIIYEEDIEELYNNNVLYIIERTNIEYLLLTPEGLVFYIAIINSKRYDDVYRLNSLIIQNYEKFLLNNFRKFIFKKFDLYQTKKEGIILNFKDIGIILFFLVNGSIDKDKSFTRDDINSEKALNCAIHAFFENEEFDEEKRSKVRIRILQSDISLLNSKIGYIVYNEKSTYYLRSKDLPFLLKILKENIKSKKKKEILSRWHFFLKEYEYWRPLLRQNNICFYDRFEVKKIEHEILGFQ